ncbi:HNH/ENDO VII family nuclease [Brevibacillus dissolubilis]|uniref:HNH/ENDO VII family nuclease n=1 Tax=Brevibacillus dissolubilis TaxID=1844116 RepID=UPI0011172A27|nr:HNH/ENDO VII family nuclease [Brevibacillus dissolubilis]
MGFWGKVLDRVQVTLDVVGLIPGIGEAADLVNAGISLARGNYADAALSLAAMVPFAGAAATAAKLGKKALKAAQKMKKVKKKRKKGLVLTAARKPKNNLSKQQLLAKMKKKMKNALAATKRAISRAKNAVVDKLKRDANDIAQGAKWVAKQVKKVKDAAGQLGNGPVLQTAGGPKISFNQITKTTDKPLKQTENQRRYWEAKEMAEKAASKKVNKTNKAPKDTHTKVEFQGRKVYQRNDIDWNKVDPDTGMTNLERMEMGWAPIGKDGKKISLHHILQIEPGPMLEILQTVHQKNYKVLHGLLEKTKFKRLKPLDKLSSKANKSIDEIEKIRKKRKATKQRSFRNDPDLDKQYNKFREDYWIWRAEEVKKSLKD